MFVSFNSRSGDIPRLIGIKLSSSFRNTDKATLGVIRVETKISYCSGIEVASLVKSIPLHWDIGRVGKVSFVSFSEAIFSTLSV